MQIEIPQKVIEIVNGIKMSPDIELANKGATTYSHEGEPEMYLPRKLGLVWYFNATRWYLTDYALAIKAELKNPTYLSLEEIRALPETCADGWDEIKFCSRRNGSGNGCMLCINK
jgi:hypothetical protein